LCQAAAGGPVRVFADTLTAARDYIPVEVVAEVVVRLLEVPVPSRVYNLGAGHAVSFAQLLQWCARWHQEWGPLRVELVPNPVTNAYQYFTCADMAALDAALPGRPAVTAALVHGRAAALFARFRADADAGRLATAVG
jgi:ADP-L-glycero-D-manno-heptose 6-epimerase